MEDLSKIVETLVANNQKLRVDVTKTSAQGEEAQKTTPNMMSFSNDKNSIWFNGKLYGGSVVGHFVVAEHIGVVPVLHGDTVPSFSFGGEVSTSGYFVPLVLIGPSILVLVIGHHDYARLAAASLGRIGSFVVDRVECIAIDTEVTQSGHIGYSVVKAYDHVSAPASQGAHISGISLSCSPLS